MEGKAMKEYKAEIHITKIVRCQLITSLKIEAESECDAERKIHRMLEAYECFSGGGSSQSMDQLIDLCEDNITDFEENDDNWTEVEVESTDVLSIEEAESEEARE
jgi:hypothetical protein